MFWDWQILASNLIRFYLNAKFVCFPIGLKFSLTNSTALTVEKILLKNYSYL